jgi:hypothetical protein
MGTNNVVIGVLVVMWLVKRQLSPRTVKETEPYRLMVILAAVGAWQIASYVEDIHVPTAAWELLILSFGIGVVLAYVRGALVHVWRDGDVLMRQGNAVTLTLWIASIALHIGSDLLIEQTSPGLDQLGRVSLLLYLAVAIGVQRVATLRKADRLSLVASRNPAAG